MIALLLDIAPPAVMSPRLDTPYRLGVHEDRRDSGGISHFKTERRIVFHREKSGLVADMTLVRVSQDLNDAAAKRFTAGAGALLNRTLRLHLADDGAVTAVDDQAALWTATVAGIAAMASRTVPPGDASALARNPAAMLADVPEARQRSILAGPLATMIAPGEAALAPGTQPVSLPGGALAGGRALAGTREVEERPGHRLRIAVRADDGATHIDRERIVDRDSGLAVSFDDTVTVGDPASPIVHQHIVFDLPVT